jgi:hypothetical protein
MNGRGDEWFEVLAATISVCFSVRVTPCHVLTLPTKAYAVLSHCNE